LFNGTTAQAGNPLHDPVLPERSHYFDAGINQVVPLGCYSALARDCASAEFGVDAYYKIAKDLLDNGQFGQALVLNAFNYDKGINEGVEFSAKFHSSYLEAYFNYAYARQSIKPPRSYRSCCIAATILLSRTPRNGTKFAPRPSGRTA
jgi:hypothetical protein